MKYDITLYHRKTNGTVKVWHCWISDVYVHSEWGQQGGTMSPTKERGIANRTHTAEEVAALMWSKKVSTKKKKGYVENLAQVTDNVQVNEGTMNFERLPRSFAPAKPIKTFDPNEMAKWDRDGLLYIQRKRDGMRHYLVSNSDGAIRIYSSGKQDMTKHLQPLVENLGMPPRSVIDVELVVTVPGEKDSDGFLTVSGIARSLPTRAQEMIAASKKRGERVQLHAFDLLWWDGEPIYKQTYQKRYRLLKSAVPECTTAVPGKDENASLITMPLLRHRDKENDGLLVTLSEAISMVKKNGWEGLVVWRKDQRTMVQMNGTPKRINCWKLKPISEEDVVAYDFQKGKGKNANVVGKFLISDRKDGNGWAPMGRCGTGLDDKTRKEALSWKYPCVIQIEYDQKSEKGFRFPVFRRLRLDKKPKEFDSF